MASVIDEYHQLCTDGRIPETRRKNFLASLRYLAASFDSTPEQLMLTPEVESTYKARLRDHLTAQGKKAGAVRNAVQEVGQFIRLAHDLPKATPIPQATRPRPRWKAARDAMAAVSPYRHQAWLTQSKYVLPEAQWPADITDAFERFKRETRHRLRPASVRNYIVGLSSLLGYLSMTPDERVDRLPPDARQKIHLRRYADDLQMIRGTPQTVAWDDLFILSHLESFVTWHAWRIHTPADAKVRERPPSMPSQLGVLVVETMIGLAETLRRPDDAKVIRSYRDTLRPPKRIHDKTADYHQFTFQELEDIAKALMYEARTMDISFDNGKGPVEYPGAFAAQRFQLGLVLMMGWRVPIRARNWCEALLDTNLRKVNGTWRWHFEGHELKIATRRGETNVLDIEIDPDVVPFLEEYLDFWRKRLPHWQDDRHVLLTLRGEGGMLKPKDLYIKLKVHVYRLSGKRMFPHLLRSIFTSNMLSSGMDINSVAYGLNDNPATVLRAYNELQASKHTESLHDAYRRALAT